jgi:uncharacterized membrane protein
MSASKRLSEHDAEQLIGRLLQTGVLLAAAVTLVGGALLLAQHGSSAPAFSDFRGQPGNLTSIIGILRGVRAGQSDAIVQLGIVLLIATPIARVAFTLVVFALQRDRIYVFITLFVLMLLLYGLLLGKA